jgi:hypothetical protein
MKLYTTFVATAALAVSPASSSMTPAEYHSLPTLDTDEMRADFLSVIRPRHHHQRVLFHDEPNPFSPKCILTEQLLTLAAEPPTLPTPSNDTETRTLDYAADQNAFDAFDSDCNSLGGQTLTYDMEVSDGCGLEFLRLLNFPHCFGSHLFPHSRTYGLIFNFNNFFSRFFNKYSYTLYCFSLINLFFNFLNFFN